MKITVPVVLLSAAALLAMGCSAGTQLPKTQAKHPGQLLFNGHVKAEVNCWECHNGNGRGSSKGPDLKEKVPKLDNAAILESIDTGTFFMPAYGDIIKRDEQTKILDWLRSAFGSPTTHKTPDVETEDMQ